MNKLIKIDECLGKKRWLQITDKIRGDVLSLMCNETIPSRNNRNSSGGTSFSDTPPDFRAMPNDDPKSSETTRKESPEIKWELENEDEVKNQSHCKSSDTVTPQAVHNAAAAKNLLSPVNVCNGSKDFISAKGQDNSAVHISESRSTSSVINETNQL